MLRIGIYLIQGIQNRINRMTMANGNFQFLTKCKQLAHQNRLKQLIISDQQINSSSLLTEEQILVSQYASAMQDQIINPTLFKPSFHYSLPVIFAMLSKSSKMGNLELMDRILTSYLRESSINKGNKHIVMFNKVKILQKNQDLRKAIFYCQNSLKEAGDGSDYYTYQFLKLLNKQGRVSEAMNIAQRHLQGDKSLNKHKIQSSYLQMLHRFMQKDQKKGLKKLEAHFNNKKISIMNIYNIALLLKKKYPQKSLQWFKKLLSYINQRKDFQFSKISALTKVNIIEIYEKSYLCFYPTSLTKYRAKEILEQCQNLYGDLEMVAEFNEDINQRRKKNAEIYSRVLQEIRNQNNINFLTSISSKKKIANTEFKYQNEQQSDQPYSEANKNQRSNKNLNQSKYYNQKRAENQKRLKFLLNKQKQLKQFFNKLKIERDGSKLNIKVLEKSLIQKTKNSPIYNLSPEQLELYETKYQDKKRKIKALYEDQLNYAINSFIDQWITPYQKNHVKVKGAEKMKNFVITLQCPNEDEKQNSESENFPKSQQKIKTCRTIQQGFRVKMNTNAPNTARKGSEKILQALKHHDHISHQMMNNLKNNMAEKRKEERQNSAFYRKNFKQMLHEGKILQQQNKLQEAHQHYTMMYKKFKQSIEKQTLLLKIAQNFEKLQFFQEAEKTYLKCTKFKSTEAFFRLGSLQIRNGKVQLGVDNLQKANCIQRNNIKIQVQLVYGYSLMQQTTQRALALANQILKRNPQCLQALIMSSKILQKKGKLKQALEIAMAIGKTVKTAATFHYIGLLYLNDSNVSQAYRYFHKALECQSNHIPSLIELATIISQAKPHDAIQILKNVLSMDSRNQLAFARLGKIYESFENDYDNALMIYKKGLQSIPSYENYVKIGDCYLKKGSIVDAYLNYKQALAIKATSQIYQKLAQVHELQHQDKKAVEVYALALALLPKDGSNSSFFKQKKYLEKLGRLSLINQEFEAAYGYLSEVSDMQQSFDVLKMLGQACFGKGDYSQALNHYERAASMLPQDNLQILQCMAMCFDKQQQYLTSKQIYQKILSIDPKNIKCLNNLANILLIIGKTNQAFYWYQFMLQQSPNNLQKRLRLADIYATIGDWSKVQQHLLICHKQKENDMRVIQRMVNLYKEKRDIKQLSKFQKRLGLLKSNTGKVIN